ncbi:MAG: hypothetical protein WC113_02680 [Candidatus Paceibacterota bacterium]|jgi:hypothetical protein
MYNLKIVKAIYYDPDLGADRGTDVTAELSSQIIDGKLFYNGVYNNILPDHFKSKIKRLKIEIEYNKKIFTKFYNENERINLPDDLGKIKNPLLKNFLIFFSIFIIVVAGIMLARGLDIDNPLTVGILSGIIADLTVLIITKIFF